MTIAAGLLSILVCPVCKGELTYAPEVPALDCPACALRYPVRENIPVMLVDEAEKLR
jgi:uncharacterized protein YbaR (Trm112 family)